MSTIDDFIKQFRTQGGTLLSDSHNQLSIFSPDRLVEEVTYLQSVPQDLLENYPVPPTPEWCSSQG